MINFLICGFIFIYYAAKKFIQTKIFYPSVIYSLMWGIACLYISAILNGYGQDLFLRDYYDFKIMDTYIVYFTIASLLGFILAQSLKQGKRIRLMMDMPFINSILKKYKWIMWLNFFGGILRIIVMANLVGFENMMDYRIAANELMMRSSLTPEGIVFKITAYVQLLANFYLCIFGLKHGLEKLKLKSVLYIFILYAPPQIATGGRLFILYFLILFFGAFLIGRGIAKKIRNRPLLDQKEKRFVISSLLALLSLVPLIAIYRSQGESEITSSSKIEQFAYITEGVLMNELFMQYYPEGSFKLNYGTYTFLGTPSDEIHDFFEFKESTKLSSVIHPFFFPFYWDFGYWGSILMIFIFALCCEMISIRCLCRLNFINFCIYMVILKMCYESVMTLIFTSVPNWELIILFYIFQKYLFGKTKKQYIVNE